MKTGIISNYIATSSEQKKIKKRYLEQGCFIKFVSPERYRTYYTPQKVYYFCSECDYEFRGEESVIRVEQEKYDDYLEERDIYNELSMYQKSFLRNVINRIVLYKQANDMK